MGRSLPKISNGRTASGAKLQTLQTLQTLQDLFVHTEKTHWKFMKSSTTLIRNGRKVIQVLGPSRRISVITSADLSEAYAEIVDEGAQPATANRKMAAISLMLTVAKDAGAILAKPKVPKQKESEGRTRYLTEEESTKLIALLDQWGQIAGAA